MSNAWSHDEAFPLIARLISTAHQRRKDYVSSRELAQELQRDPAGSALIEGALSRFASEKSAGTIAQNMVDWFSARFESEGFEWAQHFVRIRQDDVWAYKPRTLPLPFVVGSSYTKDDIYRIAQVPPVQQKGNWNTGYTQWREDWYIFCNVGVPGRTGHDYANRFVGDELHWFGKTGSHVGQKSILSMLEPTGCIYVFYRREDRSPFTFAGLGRARVRRAEASPAELTFSFEHSAVERSEALPEEVPHGRKYAEGATKTITVNAYERNPRARQDCIDAHGVRCSVCGFDFATHYGDIGKGFIHVHHLKPLGEIGVEYELDPVSDLRPVCPNCHAMIHRRSPAYSIEEMRQIYSAMAQARRRRASLR